MSDAQNHTPTLQEIRDRLQNTKGRAFWRGLDEVADTDAFQAFMAEEFPRQAAPLEASLKRRDFLKLLGASLALAGLSACARPPLPHEKIVPYVRQPEEVVPGRPLHYATAITDGGYAEGLLAESHQGRPTKVEGNPDHPASLGATTAVTQATVLTLYDPDRSQAISEDGAARTWADLAEAFSDLGDGSGVRLLTETVTSPTLARQITELQRAHPELRWHQYDPQHADGAVLGARAAYGRDVQVVPDFGAADVVFSLDADFMNRGPGRLAHARAFARRRRVRTAEDTMNRLYMAETTPSPTGSLADHRLRLAPAEIAGLAAVVARRLGVDGPEAELSGEVDPALVDALVEDLEANRGRSLVVAGQDQPAEVHALALAMNEALDAVGRTVSLREPVEMRPESHAESLGELVDAMNAGEVERLVILGANPVYTAPAALDFAAALRRVGTSLHMGLYRDETGSATTWHVPEAHHLETWSDARAFDGTANVMQPLIQPFYGGRAPHELLSLLSGAPDASAHDLVRETWRQRVDGDFEGFWRDTVHRGTVRDSAASEVDASLGSLDLSLPPRSDELTLVLRPDPSLGDGRWSNNGWLQELPKPFTKLTWDNAALLSAATAESLGVRNEDLLDLEVEGRSVTAPVWILPGQADGVVVLHLGYGREAAGRVGDGVGVDAYRLMGRTPGPAPVRAAKARGRQELASTQLHAALDGTAERRHIVRHGTLQDLQAEPDHPSFVHPVEHHESDLRNDYVYESYAWGMVIDMSVCTGCNACVTACQAENNVPIVGKDQVRIGREMHWIRVDGYFAGGVDDPDFYHMPMACQHCERAPCEPVCPVGATVHDSEGLNVMVYNRCVGTRYCSNNCPYKVRRFNYLQYAELEGNATELSLANNPDVTVRSRGVMEKCTYCTQRISRARVDANAEDRAIRDGEIVTACQAACPSEAIVFGDTNDPESRVTATKRSVLNYAVLEELNTVPRTTYLAHVRNPHPALAGDDSGVA
ncbi:MAG: TAT-variant-translocated molybdopterin oxidoreductase [Trueperaceae bacterium]|nr:TAT-variant-translocated molybdopterin oxidoreductase [Trueperaceae bacterium]